MLSKLQHRIDYLNHLVRKQCTGTPRQLARRLGLSERAWFKLRDYLIHDLKVPLAYCPVRQTYYYREEGELVFGFRRKLDNRDLEKLEGGRPPFASLAHRLAVLRPLHAEYSAWR